MIDKIWNDSIRNKRYEIVCGDSLERLKNIPDNTISAIVTDPPYGIFFMLSKWDDQVPSVEIWKECLRVLKPGGHLLSFSGIRTQHKMTSNIEDSGFEIRDVLMWVYSTGMPHGNNIEKSIKKISDNQEDINKGVGMNTTLKPSYEPIIMARKPICNKTVAENVLEYGTGAINTSDCKMGDKWPANIIHDGSNEMMEVFNGKEKTFRMFCCPKASKKDKEEGLGAEFEAKVCGVGALRDGGRESKPRKNTHPTVKNTDLMRWLCKLVTPKDGILLDPFMGCYDEKTDVLTRHGWRSFKDIELNDELLTRSSDGYIQYQNVTHLHRYFYQGEMVSIKSRSTDLLVTPNHNMLVLSHADFCAKRDARLIKANELNNSLYRIPCGGTYIPENRSISRSMMYLLGLYISEGYIAKNEIIICQNSGEKMEKMKKWVSEFNPLPCGNRKFRIKLDNSVISWIELNCGKGCYNKKISPLILSNEHLDALYDAMIEGDGCRSNGQTQYFTSSKELANGFQELCVKLNKESRIRIRKPKSMIKKDGRRITGTTDQYVIIVRESINKKIIPSKHISYVPFNGEVFCATVPNHTLYVRRNGTTSWCGNSGSTGKAAIQEGFSFIGIDLSDEYVKIADARIRHVSNPEDLIISGNPEQMLLDLEIDESINSKIETKEEQTNGSTDNCGSI